MNPGCQRPALVEEIRRRVPESPGVYLFHGEGEEILYVGKAVRLRRRMLSHLRADPREDEARHARLLYEVRGIAWETVASELLALLREDELIKSHRPRYNVRQNQIREYRYLELTPEALPRLRVCDHADGFLGRRVFGPFRDRYLADRILRLVQRHLGLRSCADPDPAGKCLEFDLGSCTGPCRGKSAARAYASAVARAVAFLEGDVSEMACRLRRGMKRAADKLEFETARELKERLRFCRGFGERQRFLAAFREERLLVTEEDDPGFSYLFVRGRLVAHGTTAAKGPGEGDGALSAPERPLEDLRLLLDRAALVRGWLLRNSARRRHRFLEPEIMDGRLPKQTVT